MRGILPGLLLCAALGAVVTLSGADRLLPLEKLVPPPLPRQLAALPDAARVEVVLVRSDGLVRGLAAGLSPAERALLGRGAVALVDGRVFAVSAASARGVIEKLGWDALPIQARQLEMASMDRFVAPQPATLAWRAKRDAWLALDSARDQAARHPGFSATVLVAALLLLLRTAPSWRPRRAHGAQDLPLEASPWRRRRAERPVRVVLVPDLQTLGQLRVAIGEEHVVAATEHAFAFADGWILAARKGSVFELVGELGWRMRPLEMATRAELVGEGHALSPLPGDDGGDALGLLEALHVCGPVAHGTLPRIASAAGSRA